MNIIILAISFCLPLFPRLLAVLIILLVLFWLFSGNLKDRFFLFLNNKIALFFSAFYFLHIIGLFYSDNFKSGLADIETKLSLLIFPIFFSTMKEKIDIHKVLKVFILGCFITSAVCFSKALYLYLTQGVNKFFYSDFSLFLHPSYFALYLNLAIITLFIWNFNTEPDSKNIMRVVRNYFSILFFLVTIVFLSSKIGIISLLFTLISACAYLLFVKKKYLNTLIHFLFFFIVMYFFFVYFINESRFATLQNIMSNVQFQQINSSETDTLAKNFINYGTTESSQVRYLVWHESIELIKENWLFGFGIGDFKDKLLDRCKAKKMWWTYEKKINSHNQFLQTMGVLGIPGIFLLIGGFVIAIIHSIKYRKYIYANFLIFLFLNFMVESMLERQAGVIFFAFFNSLLFFSDGFAITDKHYD